MITREFVDEDDGGAGAGLLVVQPDAVIGGDVWHERTFAYITAPRWAAPPSMVMIVPVV